MIIKVIGHNGNLFSETNDQNPWSYFFKILLDNGHAMSQSINDSNFDVLISNSYRSGYIGRKKMNKRKRIKKILILWEPKQVNPKLYRKSHLMSYDHIYTPSKLWIDQKNSHYFNWPQGAYDSKLESEKVWIKRKNKAVLISGNKFSVIKGELYSLRRSVIQKCSRADILDLGGTGWRQSNNATIVMIAKSLIKSRFKNLSFKSLKYLRPNLESYIGLLSNKLATQDQYKISLVVENSSDYISEKLFDALASQNIVIYVGADVSKFKLNRNMVLQTDENVDSINDALIEVLEMTPSKQYELMCLQQSEYRKIIDQWNNKTVLENLAKSISTLLV
jgi:hypothetical protein